MSVELIAEIGKNFVTTEEEKNENVLLEHAKDLIYLAYKAGADTAKFQMHQVEDEVHPDARIVSPHFPKDRYEWVKRNSYSIEFWWNLKEFCRIIGINFLVTPMSRRAAEVLNEDLGVERWKIGSGDILDFVMLDYIRDTGRPVILSSGMSTLKELKMAYEFLREKTRDVAILHCVSEYPCELSHLNLATIPFLKHEFGCKVGFSDHSLGIEGSAMAVQLGAEIIEKHFTEDRSAFGPDHKVSLVPTEMLQLALQIQAGGISPTIEAMGKVDKGIVSEAEGKFRPVFRKGLYAARDIPQGEILERDDIISLRPMGAGSVPSENFPYLCGRTARAGIKKFDPLNHESVA